MKKIILVCSILLFMFGCSKETEEEIEKIIAETESTEAQEVEVKEEVEEPALETGIITVTYNHDSYGAYKTQYELFKNQHHPNGYVIIHDIRITLDDVTDLYGITESIIPKNYIEYIHTHDRFGAEKEYENVTLANNEKFRGIFRTAEAMIVASIKYDVTEVTEEQVSEAAQRMINRQCGVSLE